MGPVFMIKVGYGHTAQDSIALCGMDLEGFHVV